MKRMMYLLSDRPYGKNKPCGYCYDNGYYIYQVYRDDEHVYNEKLFTSPEKAIDVLLKLKKEEGNMKWQ